MIKDQINDLLNNQNLNNKAIAQRLNISLRTVQRYTKKIKKGGYPVVLGGLLPPPPPLPMVPKFAHGTLRLHNQQFNIKLVWVGDSYKKRRHLNTRIVFNSATVVLNPGCIDVYSKISFFGSDPSDCLGKSQSVWNDFFLKLEGLYNVVILKERKENIKQVRAHFSLINNELAKDFEMSGDKFKVFAPEDGKLCLLIDNSFNLHEFEAVHPKTGRADAEKVQDFFKDIRENGGTLSKVLEDFNKSKVLINDVILLNKETAAGLNVVVGLLNRLMDNKEDFNQEDDGFKPDYFG